METANWGDKVPIEATILDASLVPLIGKTDIKVDVRRVSDGMFFDFADSTFKGSGWTTRQATMTEVDSTNAPGVYQYTLDTALLPSNDEVYAVVVDQVPLDDAANVTQATHLKLVGALR